MFVIILIILFLCILILSSAGIYRWCYYYGINDPQNNITPSIKNLFWYIKKYDLEI